MMTPGTYLAKRRQAAKLSIDDVAAQVSTAPHLVHLDRIVWIGRIEDDVAEISPDVRIALRKVFRFSRSVLIQLIELRSYGRLTHPLPRLCRLCACSEHDPCLIHGEPCAWSAEDLCTACAPIQPEEIARAA